MKKQAEYALRGYLSASDISLFLSVKLIWKVNSTLMGAVHAYQLHRIRAIADDNLFDTSASCIIHYCLQSSDRLAFSRRTLRHELCSSSEIR